jgi:hypothetical protein
MSHLKRTTCFFLLLSIALSACTAKQAASPAMSSSDVPQAAVLFMVEIPSVESSPGSIMLNVLDEVTGLALNPTTFKMQKRDDTHFSVELPVNLGTVLKYRYSRSDAVPIMETSTTGEDIRYRMIVVDAPMTIYDKVAAWGDYPYQGSTGKIVGSILDITSNTPVPNILVCAGGLTSFTASDGSFTIYDLPNGTHNLVAYSLDGSYLPFQQGALVESGMTTPAEIKIIPGQLVNLTFLLQTPDEYEGLPVRLSGSLSQLGNTFSDLSGGTSVVAARMPILAGLEDGRRYVTISVSAGTYIEYKYTLGDGFWNSELDEQGRFKLRGLVVPSTDTIIQDEVTTWVVEGTEPIQFDVIVPENTPAEDGISIQFNPFGWMEPIPMWQNAENHWKFTVYNPITLAGNFTYRYCRNEQCGVADDAATAGMDNSGRSLPTDTRIINDIVEKWQAFDSFTKPDLSDAVLPYGMEYITGIEFSPQYHPDWSSHFENAMREIQATGANTIILTPSFTCSDPENAYCDLNLSTNPTWQETYKQIWQAKQLGLSVFLFPEIRFTITPDEWWNTAPRDTDWWKRWYVNYKRFIIHFADLAEQSGVRDLVVGGEWTLPSLPDGNLPDGSASQVPGDSITYWMDILSAIRSHYSGTLIWSMNYPQSFSTPPVFLNSVDALYVTFNGAIATTSEPNLTELQDGFAGIIDSSVYALYEQYGKPIYIGIDYPSAQRSAAGCMSSTSLSCGETDPDIQTEIYRAALTVVNYRDWLSGFISKGFYPPTRLNDNSSSIHGKPAQDILGYWYLLIKGSSQ